MYKSRTKSREDEKVVYVSERKGDGECLRRLDGRAVCVFGGENQAKRQHFTNFYLCQPSAAASPLPMVEGQMASGEMGAPCAHWSRAGGCSTAVCSCQSGAQLLSRGSPQSWSVESPEARDLGT